MIGKSNISEPSKKKMMAIKITPTKKGFRKRGIHLFILAALLLFAIGAYNIYQYHKTVEKGLEGP